LTLAAIVPYVAVSSPSIHLLVSGTGRIFTNIGSYPGSAFSVGDRIRSMQFTTILRSTVLLAALAAGLYAQKPALTEDFESGKIDPAVWETRQKGGETIAVEAVDGAHGKFALHVHYPENERGAYAFIVATHLPDSLRSHYFGRAYMKFSPGVPQKSHAPLIFTGEPGWPISKFQEIGLSNGDWMPSYQENKSAAGQGRGEDTHRSNVEPPADRWFLLEWEFNDNPNTITIWVDGQLVPNKVGGQDVTVVPFVWPKPSPNAGTPVESRTSNLVGGYQEWGFGNRVWQVPAPAMDIYYDDIAISATRIGK